MVEKNCTYCLRSELSRNCWLVAQVKNQAKDGGLTLEVWESYISNIQEIAKSECLFPDQLKNALRSAKPNLKSK